MNKKVTVGAAAMGLLAFPASAMAWGNPELDVRCDQNNGEAVGTYTNDDFDGSVKMDLSVDGKVQATDITSGHHAEIRYRMPGGERTVTLVVSERANPSASVSETAKFTCEAPKQTPSGQQLTPPPTQAPATLVTLLPAPPTHVCACIPDQPKAKTHRAKAKHRHAVRKRQRAHERRMNRRARHRATSHKKPKSTG